MKKKEQSPAESPFASGAGPPPRLTAEDIQAKEFRIARLRGYKERDVDEFLDELTLAWGVVTDENHRLRAQAGGVASVGAPDLDDVSRQADEIIARARQEAGRIVAEAEVTAVVRRADEGDRAAVSSFLSKERAFLQELATLVQGHAEGVKGMAREVFAKPPASAAPAASAESTPAPGADASAAASESSAEPPSEEPPSEEPPSEEPPSAGPSPVQTRPAEAASLASEPTAPAPGTDEEPIRIEEPETDSVRVPEHDEEPGDRSLKELFWGEE
ncbi:MAG TPA: DivIVA domain-containing protein [Actinomycetota bacterium]|jgi:DivIVA domain-containing protein|nr:DivIVA domain-containing protein [Actinomycetota bacterium]